MTGINVNGFSELTEDEMSDVNGGGLLTVISWTIFFIMLPTAVY